MWLISYAAHIKKHVAHTNSLEHVRTMLTHKSSTALRKPAYEYSKHLVALDHFAANEQDFENPEGLPFERGAATGIPALDRNAGGIPRAALTQICIPRNMSSGKTAVLCSFLAEVTDMGEMCGLIDASDSFDTGSAKAEGVDLDRLLWVRCGKKRKTGQEKGGKTGNAKHGMATGSRQKADHKSNSEAGISGLEEARQKSGFAKPHDAKRISEIGGFRVLPAEETTVAGEEVKSRRRVQTGADHPGKPGLRGIEGRMKPLEQAFKAADILIQNGGFGLIAIDLSEIEEGLVRKIPLTTWFRFARVIEKQPTALVVFASYPAAQSCAALTLHLKRAQPQWTTGAHWGKRAGCDAGALPSALSRHEKQARQEKEPAHGQFLSELKCEVEVGRVRGRGRKPVQSAGTSFTAVPAWK
jgi:recombination protein RecA